MSEPARIDRGAARPGHRHRATRSQGAGARRVRRVVDVAEPAACLPDRAGPRGGPRRSRTSTATSSSTSRPASRSTRPVTAHPQVVAAIKEQAAELIHFSAADFYLPIYPEVCKRLAEIAPIDGPGPRLPRQLRSGGGRGGDQTRPARDEAPIHRRVPRRLPWPDVRRPQPDRQQGEVPRGVRTAVARRVPRPVRQGR